MITKDPSLSPWVAATPNLLGIPREIRNIIYENCLCVDGYLVPYMETIHQYQSDDAEAYPGLGLLATNKQIREEAVSIFYGNNKWRVVHDTEPHSRKFRSIFKDHRSTFRQIIIYCSQLDYDPACFVSCGNEARRIFRDDKPETKSLHKAWVHVGAHRSLIYAVRQKVYAAMRMPHLTSFVIDVEELYCPMGCCRIHTLKEVASGMVGCWHDMRDRLGEGWKPTWEATFVGLANSLEAEALGELNDAVPPIPYIAVIKQQETDDVNPHNDDSNDGDSDDNADEGDDADEGDTTHHEHSHQPGPEHPETDDCQSCPTCGSCHRRNRLLTD